MTGNKEPFTPASRAAALDRLAPPEGGGWRSSNIAAVACRRERGIGIMLLAIAMGSLFVTSYCLALGDPVPRHISAALVGGPAEQSQAVAAGERAASERAVVGPGHVRSMSFAVSSTNAVRAPRIIEKIEAAERIVLTRDDLAGA